LIARCSYNLSDFAELVELYDFPVVPCYFDVRFLVPCEHDTVTVS